MRNDFKELIEQQSNKYLLQQVLYYIFFLVLSIIFIWGGEKASIAPIKFLGIGFAFFTCILLIANRKWLKSGSFWIKIIENNPNKIIWIKPINTKHTIGFVITLFKTKEFQLCTEDGFKTEIKCNSDDKLNIFFDGVKNNLSYAHIGYSDIVNELYSHNPKNFIKQLKKKGLYSPISNFQI